MRALRPFKDAGGRERRTGEEWLVTMADREAHIPSVAEEVVGVVDVTTLSSRQYCVILDPVGPDGKPQLGQKRVVKVRRSFGLAVSSFAAFIFSGLIVSPRLPLSGRALVLPAARGAPGKRHPGRVRAVGGGGASAASCGGL